MHSTLSTLVVARQRQEEYFERVLATRRANLIWYSPLDELSGTTIRNLAASYAGTYTGVTLGQTGIGDGKTAPFWDGLSDYGNIHSAGLASAFNGDEGSLMLWALPNSGAMWTDGIVRLLGVARADDNNLVWIYRSVVNNTLVAQRIAGGTTKAVSYGVGFTDFRQLVCTWSKTANQFKLFANGIQIGATQTGLGAWAGALANTSVCIGARNTTPESVWHGRLAHYAVWNAPLTQSEISALARLR